MGRSPDVVYWAAALPWESGPGGASPSATSEVLFPVRRVVIAPSIRFVWPAIGADGRGMRIGRKTPKNGLRPQLFAKCAKYFLPNDKEAKEQNLSHFSYLYKFQMYVLQCMYPHLPCNRLRYSWHLWVHLIECQQNELYWHCSIRRLLTWIITFDELLHCTCVHPLFFMVLRVCSWSFVEGLALTIRNDVTDSHNNHKLYQT